jgi:transposase
MNKKYHAIQRKITNLVDELHFKTCNHLCKNYHTIVIGKISTQSIVRGDTLTAMTKRVLLALRHYEFRMRLKAKCEESNIQFYEVDESYTTKTCSVCGIINHEVGANKTFKCVNAECHVKMKRDYNGARGIFLKNYEEYKEICLF